MFSRLRARLGIDHARAERSTLQLVADALTGELNLHALDAPTLKAVTDSAGQHGVAGLLDHPALATTQLAIRAKNLRARRFTTRVGDALGAANVDHVVLKGIACAARWKDPTVRLQSDLDVLVAPSDLQRAGEVLQQAALVGPRIIDGEHLHNATFEPIDRGALMLELHHDLSSHHHFTADVPALLARRVKNEVWSLAAEDDAVYLALHACTHGLGRLAWLVDLDGLHRAGVDWVEAARRAQQLGIGLPVGLAWEATRRLLCVPIPTAAFDALGASAAQWRLARRLLDAAESSTGDVHQTFERLFRLALVSPLHLPAVLARKLRANAEEQAGHAAHAP